MAEKTAVATSGGTLESPTPPLSKNSSSAANTVHCVLNNKGGIGKTIVAMELVQYLRESRRIGVQAIDLDPMNHTLSEYAGLGARSVDLLERDHAAFNGDGIDGLAGEALTMDSSFVIDNGSAGFVRFTEYLVATDFAGLLAERSKGLVIHVVIAGGDMTAQCILGLNTLLEAFGGGSGVRFVGWLNEHPGPIRLLKTSFEGMKIYQDNIGRFLGLVRLPRLSPLFLADYNKMLTARLSYAEALGSPEFGIMNRQRLVMTRRAVWAQLSEIGL